MEVKSEPIKDERVSDKPATSDEQKSVPVATAGKPQAEDLDDLLTIESMLTQAG
jgi:hypothetical protein